ncbi:MAG TPA: PQQ-binding-like beta-propeller repeat protein, partial [Humisphaera sp.]|nr:PQQ-binding-like beta-propeller repeat protein [Humisphaera sp.]
LGAEGNGAIMAFDLASGHVKWQWKGDGPAYGSPIVATIEGVKQIVEQTEKNIVGISAADGKLLWQTPYGGGGGGMSNNTATPVIDGSTVIVSGRGTKAIKVEKSGDAFAAKDLWNNAQASIQYNTPVLDNGMLFGFSSGSTIFCLNEKDGTTLWTDNTNRNARGFGSLVAAGPVIFMLTQKAELTAFEPSDKGFKELAKYKLSNTETYAYPVISGKQVFVKDKDSVIAFSME